MFGFLDDLLKDPTTMALLGGAAIAATGGAAAPAVLGAEAAAAGGAAALGAGALEAGAAGTAALGAGATEAATAAGTGLLGSAGEAATAYPIAAWLSSGASEGSTMGNAITGAGGGAGAVGEGTTAGLLGQAKQAAGYIKPIGQAMSVAQQAKGLLAPDSAPVQGAPVQVGQGGAQSLQALYQQSQQIDQQRNQDGMQKRARRQSIYGGV